MMIVNKLETFWEVNDGSTGKHLARNQLITFWAGPCAILNDDAEVMASK